MLLTISKEMSALDPSDLTDASVWLGRHVIARLRNGELTGLSKLFRQGDTCLDMSSGSVALEGTVLLTDLNAEYTAIQAKSVSMDVSVDYVDFTVRAQIADSAKCTFGLTQCDVAVGNIYVSVGNGWIGSHVDKVVTKVTNKVSRFLRNVFKDELCNAIQEYMDNGMEEDLCLGQVQTK